MPKHCTNVMFTFQAVARECHLNQCFNPSFFNCSGFRPFKDAPGTSSSVKIVGKVSFFDVLTSLNASFAAIVFESPGSLTSMQCARDVIMQMCYSLLQAKAEGFCQQFFSLSKRVLELFSM